MLGPNITRTIRFKMTLWYSLLLLSFATVFVLFMNIIVTRFYHSDPSQNVPLPIFLPRNKIVHERWEELTDIQKDYVRELRQDDLEKVRRISMYSLVPLALLSFGGGYVLSGQMLRPIKKLNRQMKTMTAQRLDKKIRFHDVGDEISELINNFNEMTGRLKTSFELQKQFIENASHELKTPLAVIRTNLDSAMIDAKLPKDELDQHIHASLSSISFMNKLIEDLLLLSLLENQIKKEKIDIIGIAKDAASHLGAISKKQGVDIHLDIKTDKKVKIKANSVLLQRAVMNLLENALKYSKNGDTILVELSKTDEHISIKIRDQGPGIPREHRRKIFERFYRVDKSRSRKTGGSGLGLAITKKIVEMHGGSIRVSSKEGQGSVFMIKLHL